MQLDPSERSGVPCRLSDHTAAHETENPRSGDFFLLLLVRWRGLEPPRLTTHAPQACLSANSSTSAVGRAYYNRVHYIVKQANQGLAKRLQGNE